jgi:hypothetical protein
MKIEKVPFTTIEWSQVPKVEHPGEHGTSHWRTFEMGNTEKGATLFVVD